MPVQAVRKAGVSSPALALLFALSLASSSFWAHAGTQEDSEKAAQAIDRGDLDAAQSLLQAALQTSPRSARLHKLMATLDFKRQRLDAMRDELHLAIECDPKDA